MTGGAQVFEGKGGDGQWYRGHFVVQRNVQRGCTEMVLTLSVPDEYITDSGMAPFRSLRDNLIRVNLPFSGKLAAIHNFVLENVARPSTPETGQRALDLEG